MKNDNLYLLNLEGTRFCKIGVAADVQKRVAYIQTGSPISVIVAAVFATPYALEVERAAHRYLADRKVRGEWFNILPIEAEAVIQELLATIAVDLAMGDIRLRSRAPARQRRFDMNGPHKPGSMPRAELYAAVRAAHEADPGFSRAELARRAGWSEAMVRKALKELTEA